MTGRDASPPGEYGAQRLRARRRRLLLAGALLALGIGPLALTVARPPVPRLVWNASPSAPVGLYRVRPGARVAAGDMVVARLPVGARRLAARRGYLPANVPLVKRIAAAAGARVCARGKSVLIDGRRVAVRLAADRLGRALPWWEGCRTLRSGEVFLLMPRSAASFDGRYVGVTRTHEIVGQAALVWSPGRRAPSDD